MSLGNRLLPSNPLKATVYFSRNAPEINDKRLPCCNLQSVLRSPTPEYWSKICASGSWVMWCHSCFMPHGIPQVVTERNQTKSSSSYGTFCVLASSMLISEQSSSNEDRLYLKSTLTVHPHLRLCVVLLLGFHSGPFCVVSVWREWSCKMTELQ